MSDAHEDAVKAAKSPVDEKSTPGSGGAVEASNIIKAVVDAFTALGKLTLIVVIIVLLWNKRESAEQYFVVWLNSANKLGFLGWSIERQASAQQAVAQIAANKSDLTNLQFAEGAIERAARSAPAIVGSRVLWVDEHPENNRLEVKALEALGIQVFPVTSTKGAMTFFPVVRPDLVISDVVRDTNAEAKRLQNCPAHYFDMPENVRGDLSTINDGLMKGNTVAAGFSVPEAIASESGFQFERMGQRVIFYSRSAGGISASKCGRLVTNRPDLLLHTVVSALEELRWEKLKQYPVMEKPAESKQSGRESP